MDSSCLVATEFIADALLSARPPLWLHLDCWGTVVSLTLVATSDPELEQLLTGARARTQELTRRIISGLVEAHSLDRFRRTRIQWAVIRADGIGPQDRLRDPVRT